MHLALTSTQAYVWNYNVYVKETPASPSHQVTKNGAHNLILNGIPDWVYEGIERQPIVRDVSNVSFVPA